jgi:hypothetical protein
LARGRAEFLPGRCGREVRPAFSAMFVACHRT